MEKEMATDSSILSWKIPWTEEPGRLQPTGPQKIRTWLGDLATTISGLSKITFISYLHFSSTSCSTALLPAVNQEVGLLPLRTPRAMCFCLFPVMERQTQKEVEGETVILNYMSARDTALCPSISCSIARIYHMTTPRSFGAGNM